MKEEKLFLALKRLNEQGYCWSVEENTDTATIFDSKQQTPLPGKWLIISVVDYPDEVLAGLADFTESRLHCTQYTHTHGTMMYLYCIKFNNN